MDRAYSVIDIKSMDDEERVIRGIATTPTPDRVKDVIEPMGAKFGRDLPLFMHHDSRLIVGRAVFGKPSADGIPFEARLPRIAEAGSLRDRVDEAWQSVKYRLITGVSIGFKPVRDKIEQLKTGGLRFLESEILELSLVPIPMNSEAVITQFRSAEGGIEARIALLSSIKSADEAIRRAAFGVRSVVRLDPAPAASGDSTPGDSGSQARRKGVVYL
jgi:uncharacterized protein